MQAQEHGGLHRNFMGYTTHADCDLVGVGASAISHIADSYSQNLRDLKAWKACLEERRLPLWRGLALNFDDRVRAAVIGQLMCQGVIDTGMVQQHFGIDFSAYFREEIRELHSLAADGLVRLAHERIAATPVGRLLLRNIAMCFDRYLAAPRTAAETVPHSRAV